MTLSPRVDFAFKKLFGSEENKALLQGLINAILPSNEQLIEIILINPYNDRLYQGDKLSVLDVKAKDELGRYYNIEMQVTDEVYYSQRALYYWSKLYSSQLKAGDDYDVLQKTISIHILNFNCFENEANYHNVFHLLNARSHQREFEDMELHFIELEKFDKDLGELKNRLDYWTSFLATVDQYEQENLPDVLKNDPEINAAIEALEHLYLNPAEREIYDARLKWLRDESGAIKKARREALEEGLAQGNAKLQAEKRAIANNLLAEGIALSVIAKSTGLTEADIEALRDSR
jgi:predicted transposase/invertase (TIGR01784 family)